MKYAGLIRTLRGALRKCMALLVVWQKLTQRYKVVILQLKIIKLKEKVQVKGKSC